MNTKPQATEPDADFAQQTRQIHERWQRGELSFSDATSQLDSLHQQAIADNHIANQARIAMMYGVMHGYRTNIDAGIEHFERARELFQSIGNQTYVNRCNLNLGELYRQRGAYARARQLFRSVYEAGKRLEDTRLQAIATLNQGHILLSMEHLTSAERSFAEALELSDQWPEDRRYDYDAFRCEAYHGLAVIHLAKDALDPALDEAKKALQSAENSQSADKTGLANRTLGKVLAAFKEPPPATDAFSTDPSDYFKAAEEAYRELGADGELARTYYEHAVWLVGQGEKGQARRLLKRATVLFGKQGMSVDAAKAVELEMQLY